MKIQQYRNPTSTNKWASLFVISSGGQSIVLTLSEIIDLSDIMYNHIADNNLIPLTSEVVNDKLDNQR